MRPGKYFSNHIPKNEKTFGLVTEEMQENKNQLFGFLNKNVSLILQFTRTNFVVCILIFSFQILKNPMTTKLAQYIYIDVHSIKLPGH